MTIKEKAAYLKGLLSGMNLDEEKNETKLFKGIIDVIEDLSSSFENLDEDVDGILDQLEVLDEDLAHVEDKVFDDCECGCCDCDDDCDCGCHEDCYEVVCPNCNEKICLCDETLSKEEMNCPNCGQLLEFDLSDCCHCDDDCDCCDCCGDDCECSCTDEA